MEIVSPLFETYSIGLISSPLSHSYISLTKLKQSESVEDFIAAFECLEFQTEGMSDAFSEIFLSVASRMMIQAHVLMARSQSWVEATKRDKEAQQIVSSQNRKPSFIPHPKPVNPTVHYSLRSTKDPKID
jgi:hypothetical protein